MLLEVELVLLEVDLTEIATLVEIHNPKMTEQEDIWDGAHLAQKLFEQHHPYVPLPELLGHEPLWLKPLLV